MNPLLTLEFYERGGRAIINEGNQQTVTTFNIDNLRDTLTRNSIICPVFPFWVSGYANRQGSIILISTHNFMQLPVLYQNQSYRMHFPFLHFIHILKQETNGYHILSTTLRTSFEPPADQTKTYVPKLPNTNSTTGAMCYGANNVTTRVKNLLELRQKDYTFINGIHNDDIQTFTIAQYNDVIFQTADEWTGAMVNRNSTKLFKTLLGGTNE